MLASVRQAESLHGRPEGSVALLPVTKGHPPEVARHAADLGLTELGENYLQECVAKQRLLVDSGVANVRWHLLGHLQRNKARPAAQLFHRIESVDSFEVAELLSGFRNETHRLKVLLEVELTGLPKRTGFQPSRLMEEMPRLLQLGGIEVEGLMTVAAPGMARESFAACRELVERLRHLSGLALPMLSMGMSGDFREAIAEGSTEVRIGSLLFGSRPQLPD